MNSLVRFLCTISFLLTNLWSVNIAHALPVTMGATQNQASDEHIVWQRAPIEITLPVGRERFVSFPKEVQFGYSLNLLPSSVLRVENDNQTLYFLAKKPFATQRVQAKLPTGEMILLDINAKKNADGRPIDIVLPKVNNTNNFNNNPKEVNFDSINYVTLTRYAIQQLYAPERLLKQSMHITRFPMGTTHVVPLFYDGSAVAMPLASWRGGGYYVTALFIKNLLTQPLRLGPRSLCGNWKAASFYPQIILAPRGTPIDRDASTLFVVSNRPFADAIQSCLD